ncbi:hypothetical protein AB0H86_16945 [Streptomyces sp. NPDC050997]|uniref:hypothetical protein n=1 Tax=Streptomyces sp. NPDC050997 TaxID=3155519 RepID=UPI003417BDA3
MTVDPTDPTDPEKLAAEEIEYDEEIDVETPEGDAAEQHTAVQPDRDDPLSDLDPTRAAEADVIEQARVVSLDEDDYR